MLLKLILYTQCQSKLLRSLFLWVDKKFKSIEKWELSVLSDTVIRAKSKNVFFFNTWKTIPFSKTYFWNLQPFFNYIFTKNVIQTTERNASIMVSKYSVPNLLYFIYKSVSRPVVKNAQNISVLQYGYLLESRKVKNLNPVFLLLLYFNFCFMFKGGRTRLQTERS